MSSIIGETNINCNTIDVKLRSRSREEPVLQRSKGIKEEQIG